MDHTARGRARAVAQAVALNGERRMLDLGGGSGAYSIAFVKAASALHSEIVDLPEVLPITEEHIRHAGMSDRISTRAGDMLNVSLAPASYDLILLSAICHMFSPEENRQLLGSRLRSVGAARTAGYFRLYPRCRQNISALRYIVCAEHAGGYPGGSKL